jgi:hypothetical protein
MESDLLGKTFILHVFLLFLWLIMDFAWQMEATQ